MPASAISASYVYMGLALRKALAIGLHLEPDEPGLSEDEKEMRRRLWWSVYSLERTVTIKLNRPRSISQDIITARLPRPVPRDAEQKFDNVQHQIVYAQLVRIIDKLSEPAAWSTNSPTNPVSTCEEALKSWKRSLPPPLKLQNIHPKSPGYRAVFHLHLNYYFAWIDMGKVSVVTVVRARLRALFCPLDPPPAPSAAVEQAADARTRGEEDARAVRGAEPQRQHGAILVHGPAGVQHRDDRCAARGDTAARRGVRRAGGVWAGLLEEDGGRGE
uniref:Transcription factor n=1 Tax=Colletotrichum fructicola (strain Nara gc5) TaxID=1213859 RepID=L2FYM2_COLFN